jgi:hypothetical protein
MAAIIFTFSFLAFTPANHEEGMYPLAQLGSLDLKKAGLEMAQSDIINQAKLD